MGQIVTPFGNQNLSQEERNALNAINQQPSKEEIMMFNIINATSSNTFIHNLAGFYTLYQLFKDPNEPEIERDKFLGIYANNLDLFDQVLQKQAQKDREDQMTIMAMAQNDANKK